MLAVIATAAVIARYSRFYRREMTESGNRELALDGLRGLAALMVATHHAALSCIWFTTGEWGDAGLPAWQMFGPAGVILFFGLTGYLFWGKARTVQGKMNPWKLWRGRLYRIAPLYLFSLILVLLVAVSQIGSHWLALENWRPMLRLLALGALKWHSLGPVQLGDYNAGVVWTLWYEWGFYLVLPLIAWLATGRKIFHLAVLAYALTIVGLWFKFNLQPGLFFMLGMLCPALLEDQSVRVRLQRPAAAALALTASLALCWACRDYLLTATPSLSVAGALFPVFFLAAAGNSFFGFLTHPAMRCLGAISFSLYLLHGIFFKLVFHLLQTAGPAQLPQFVCWLIIIGTAIGTTGLCAATYRWIEFPFLSSSHKKPA